MSIDNFHTSATKVEVIRVDTATLILNSKLAALINKCIEHPTWGNSVQLHKPDES